MNRNDGSEPEVEWISETTAGPPFADADGAPATLDNGDFRSPAVSCRRVVKVYEVASGRVQAVKGVDLDIGPGITTAVVGPSGSGKSSLLRMIAGLDRPTAGAIEISGEDLFDLGNAERARRRGRLVTHVYQRPADNLLAHLTAEQQLMRLVDDDHNDPDRTVHAVLSSLDLDHRARHVPAEMSGGEQQRLAFARAAVAGHRLVIADEPTAELDPASAELVLKAIDRLADAGTTVVVATHDERVLPHMQMVVTLRDGAVASVSRAGTDLAVIDRAGRLQLPPEALATFPDRLAQLEWDPATGELRVRRP